MIFNASTNVERKSNLFLLEVPEEFMKNYLSSANLSVKMILS